MTPTQLVKWEIWTCPTLTNIHLEKIHMLVAKRARHISPCPQLPGPIANTPFVKVMSALVYAFAIIRAVKCVHSTVCCSQH